MKEYETRTDETIKIERDKINNEKASSLEEYKSDSNDEDDDNIPLNMIRMAVQKETKGNQSNTDQVFQGGGMKK